MPETPMNDLTAAARFACVALSLRYGHDGDVIDGYEDVQTEHGGACATAYLRLRLALMQEAEWTEFLTKYPKLANDL